VVYGMPRAAEMRGAVECMLPLPEIVSFLEGLGSLSS
jgi:chemotaxis response regulator CheB